MPDPARASRTRPESPRAAARPAPTAPARTRRRGVSGARLALVAALLLAAAPACRTSKSAEAGGKPTAERARTTVRVENRSFLDHNVFVLRGGQRIRLGTVTGNSTQVFTIPSNLIFGISSLQFLVDPIGGSRQPISNEIRVGEGDEVQLVIPPA